MRPSLLVHDLDRLYTMDRRLPGLGEHERVSVGFAEGRVVYLGPADQAPEADHVWDGRGLVGTPGLVDPHTHAVWAGGRADEFRRRLGGERYTEVLVAGGGILSTVRATRQASREVLARDARLRLEGLRARGVTTVEIKSGYGLEPATELRMLQAAGDCSDTVRVVRSFLGAHALPPGDRIAYVRQVIEEQLPRCVAEADFIDVYVDRGAFSLEEGVAVLDAGRRAGLRIKAHAEQVAYTGIAEAAAQLGATSVEHLERVNAAGIAAMARAGTVAVLLPGAQLYLRDVAPPVAALREAGVPMAIGSDLNPGSSPVHDLWTCATLSCLLQGLTIEEAALGITRHAGRALGRDDVGWLGAGSVADLAVFAPPPGEPATIASLIQHMGRNLARLVVRDGVRVVG